MTHTVPDNTAPADVHPNADLIAGLRELTNLLESRPDLAVYNTTISVGALGSRADLEAWAAALGAEIRMGGTAGDIPVMYHEMAGFTFSAQSPSEPARSRLAKAEAEIARLRAELARTEAGR